MIDSADRYQLGSSGFATMVLAPLNTPSEIYLDESMAHDIKDGDDNFGTSFINASDVLLYIVQRIAVYCQAVFHGYADNLFANHKKVFEDCENYRQGCLTGNLGDSCSCCQ